MNLLKKRSTIVLASIGAAGAIAAIAIGASFAMFYDPPAPVTQTYSSGDVTLGTPTTLTCTVSGVAPGYSTKGYPSALGDQSGTPCSFKITYTGSMDAFMATDVSVDATTNGTTDECGGTCSSLYSPNVTGNESTGLEVWSTYRPLTTSTAAVGTYALGIGGDQTISDPGKFDVDANYSDTDSTNAAACVQATGDNCPVTDGYSVGYDSYVYWPLLSSSDQNQYQDSSVTITLTVHAVQAYDNPLFSCPGTVDGEQGTVTWTYPSPNQPQYGWGSGFSTDDYPPVGQCPTIDNLASDWSDSATDATIYPFSHEEIPDE